jgi:hypothetical protein
MGMPIVNNSTAVGLKKEMKIDLKNTAGGVTFLSKRSLTKRAADFGLPGDARSQVLTGEASF